MDGILFVSSRQDGPRSMGIEPRCLYCTFEIDSWECRHVRLGADRLPCMMQGSSLEILVIGEILDVLEGIWKKLSSATSMTMQGKLLLSNHHPWGTLMPTSERQFHSHPCASMSRQLSGKSRRPLCGNYPAQCDVKACLYPRSVLGCLQRLFRSAFQKPSIMGSSMLAAMDAAKTFRRF